MHDSYSQYLVPSTRLTKMDHFLEDEVIGVEHLLAEPKCNNLGDDVLGFSTFSQETCCNFEEFSTADYGSIKTDCDAQDPNLKLSEKVKEEFLKGMLGRTEAIYLDRKNDLSYTCDDYLLDTEFVDEASDDMNPIKGPCVENSGLENKSTVSGGRGCSDEISELATARIPMLQTLCQDSSLLDEMTIGELHEAFINMFGRETTVTDKQWLKRQLSFGLQNHVVSSSGNEGTISPARDQCFSTVSTHFTAAFNFRKRQRVQHVKRKKHDNHASLKALSSEDRKAVFGFSELVEKENVLVTSKRSRKPTRRYIEESLEENSRRKKRCEISTACSGYKILQNGSYKQRCHKEFEAKPYVCQKVPFKGACIQVPFGQPVCRGHLKKKVHESDGCKDSLLGSKVDSDTGSFSNKSQDDASGDDYSSGTLTQKGKSRRKNHMYWSVSEVLKLVEGVSMYGVGRWTEIKKLSFHSSANRTSVDLKDKWRNLLKASYSHLKSNREVESKRKHGSKSTPQSILHRVRELASLYPYPRERKTHVSQTASVASPIPGTSSTCDKLLPE